MNKKMFFTPCLVIILLFLVPCLLSAESIIDHLEKNTVKVYDREGNYIFSTAMNIVKGDYYINEKNYKYVIEKIEEKKATACSKGRVNLLEENNFELTPVAAEDNRHVGIYYTHNDESYLPGPESIEGHGEIHEIGNALKNALVKNGIKVTEYDNLHLPHDGAAYERSKATALKLAQQQPDAIFDIHRDAIPDKNEYLTSVNGKNISQIQIVVGRQNPNREVNNQFAKAFKAVTDRKYPGLIKGIFYGSGNYNQQIAPHSLLLEFGTHTLTKEEAKESTALIADSINTLLYGESGKKARSGENSSAFTTVFWIASIFLAGVFMYLYINEGSIQGVLKRIKGFLNKEIIDRE